MKAVTLGSKIISSAVVKSISNSVQILEENTVFEEVIGKADTGTVFEVVIGKADTGSNAYTGDDMKKPDEHSEHLDAASEAGSMKEERNAAEVPTSVLIVICLFVYFFVVVYLLVCLFTYLFTCLFGCLQPLRSQATSDMTMRCVVTRRIDNCICMGKFLQ